ncbi:hypothetical protein ACS0TY_002237 [Phlomoides rotata]
MDGLAFFVGVIGNIISVLVFLSPLKTFIGIVKKGSTEEFSSLPYICTLLGSCLWVYYGIIKPGAYLVATVNAFGVVVEIIYVALFLFFAPPPKTKSTAIMCGVLDVGFFGTAVLVTYLLLNGDMRINAVGFIASALNIIMYASPLSAMKRVVTTKSVEYMPFLLSFFLFLNGGVWTFYAILVDDWFLGVPNGIGFVLGIIQLALYAIYNTKPSSKSLQTEQRGYTEPLLPASDEQC